MIFVTDGEARVNEKFLESFNQAKKEKKFKVLSLVIGSPRNSVEPFSDRVMNIQNFEDEKSFVAFEI
ncbi:hypothetical protein ACA29_08560 [Lederbergia galactosidilytica]|uniref:VWFA domain-containing protein n=1 Tax=Lederbergia galactosidilytica TaxID=217031 RepID=A0A0Q9Y8H7_9BACI|nr:hypothetical protein ACA29_08560 [Lederbergia galactosidilytica]